MATGSTILPSRKDHHTFDENQFNASHLIFLICKNRDNPAKLAQREAPWTN